jgi:phospholipase DDHD1
VDFESSVSEEDGEDEKLDNRFGLDDIEIKGGVSGLKQLLTGVIMDVPFYLR